MAHALFKRVALKEDLPDEGFCRGDVAIIVEQHEDPKGNEMGYSLEFLNAVGETISVVVVGESQIESLRGDEIFHVRELHSAPAA
ncbi:MAG: DUF4926 domain-containing protein [Pseudomonadota bacterium]